MSNKQMSIWDYIGEDSVDNITMRNEKLVWKVIHSLKKRGRLVSYQNTFSDDDLFQIGMIGLAKAAEKFKKGKGASFSTYATLAIERNIQNELRKNSVVDGKKYTSHDSLTVGCEEGVEVLMTNNEIMEDSDQYKRMEINMIFTGMVKKYPDKEKFINEVETYIREYGNGSTWTAVAKNHGIKYATLKRKLNIFRSMVIL